MGGQKKPSLSQLEKQQRLRELREVGRRPSARVKTVKKEIGTLETPDITSKDFLEKLRGMKAVTPYQLAAQYNLRVSVAKDILEELERRKVIRLVSRSHNLKVYALCD